ncbi:hypothetical protein NDU88_006508 [Pleurodeles waltl]|uniref:Uncharacterized protein n=1 Tax=Pleurodeles waltl TaxID=8319 RepID=A0AAV7VPY8_PLEWA|nr:hypothetical protein NDU88_006508 [Pleurodeles waltl]
MRVLHFNARHCQVHNGLRSEQQYRVTDSSERRYPFFKTPTGSAPESSSLYTPWKIHRQLSKCSALV